MIVIYLVVVSARPWKILERPRLPSAALAAAFPMPRAADHDRDAAATDPPEPASNGDRPG